MRRLVLLPVILVALAGCGGDDEGDNSTVTVNQTTTVTAPPPATEQTTTEQEAPTTTDSEPLRSPCNDSEGNQINVVSGDIDCDSAKSVAAQYDTQGDRVQTVDSFTCEGGNAQTRPVIFTCSGPEGEFVVSEAGG